MTPNKSEIEEVAQDLVSSSNSAIENTMLRLISRLANTITYNAEAMNKLVDRVDELEKLAIANDKPSNKHVVGCRLQVLLAKQHVHVVKCIMSQSKQWIEGKEYVVLVNTSDVTQRKVKSETGKLLESSGSLFVEVKETQEEGEYLEMLLKRGAYKVRCVKAESNAYIVNKVYVVEQRVEARHKFVRNENGTECGMSLSRFVEVEEQREPFKQPFKLDFYGNTPARTLTDDEEHF